MECDRNCMPYVLGIMQECVSMTISYDLSSYLYDSVPVILQLAKYALGFCLLQDYFGIFLCWVCDVLL